jgi:tetratricopeptide (TPR) repeat protein
MEKYALAAAFAESALAADSTSASALMQLAVAKRKTGELAEAISLLRRADERTWQLDKSLQKTLFTTLAEFEYDAGEYDSALAHVVRALDVKPSKELSYSKENDLYGRIKLALGE